MLDDLQSERLRRVLAFSALVLLVIGLFSIVAPFLTAIAWALVLVMSTWPLFERLVAKMPENRSRAAGIATTLLALVLVVPAGVLLVLASRQAVDFVGKVNVWLQAPVPEIPPSIRNLPWIGDFIAERFGEWRLQHATTTDVLTALNADVLQIAGNVGGQVARGAFSVVVCLFTCFFFYRDGEAIASSFAKGAVRLGGERVTSLIATTRETVRGAVYGMVLTAVVQGFLAGIGYWIAGVPIPLPLAAVTTIASFIPFGTPLVYTPICVVLLTSGAPWWHGALLLGWCLVVVSMADNIIRPVFLSKATKMPLVLVVFSIFGGLASFGLLGLFVGPVIMAVAQALWKEWSAGAAAKVPSPESQG